MKANLSEKSRLRRIRAIRTARAQKNTFAARRMRLLVEKVTKNSNTKFATQARA